MPDAASSAAPAAIAPVRPRFAWVDTARGLTMIMVVLLHADAVTQAMGKPVLPILLFDYALFPLRMPMFFLVSGLLAAGLLRRPAGEVLRRRVLHYAWLYAMWLTIITVGHAWVLRDLGSPVLQRVYNKVDMPIDALLVTWNNAWFLYALMLFFALALALRRLPPAAQMGVALALAVPGLRDWGTEIGLPVLDRFYHFPYFLLGILGAERLRDAVPRQLGNAWRVAALVAGWLALAALAHVFRVLRDPIVIAALSLIAVPAGLGVAVWLAERLPRLAAPLQVVGRNTLAIYVLHTFTLRLLLAVAPPVLPDVVLIPILTLLAVALALPLGKLLEHVPGLFAVPRLGRRKPTPGELGARA
jgi:uncharacterized membrane protein YcfT